ncbi:bifunctional 2',3'-cyclic-nucleotide 2'-phosphodiesterase/3'-nucleotidase [Lichenicola sp.]|uniref:bifunctional 2',3'-cyclic-nucleotide 2'-phosphodiesterase/3'-nucleotidase n=1 Tax=Lichenicola sp. TaxID=2804529 RepID=UPI003B0100E4
MAVVKLRLLETSDLHMFIYDYDYYQDRQDNTVGLAKLAMLVRQARAAARNTMLFDNGDIIQGNPLGDYMALAGHLTHDSGHPMLRAMNLLGYDAATFGNHEFNYGLDFLELAIKSAHFPFVCANIDRLDGTSFLPRSVVLEREVTDEAGHTHCLRIGVIGFVTPQIMIWDKARLEGHVTTGDIVDAAHRFVPQLRARCDLVVALCHSGISSAARQGGEENASLYLASVPGIDVIFTGHAHRVFPGPDYGTHDGIDTVRGTLGGIPAVMPGFWGSHLGVIDLVLERHSAADQPGRWVVQDFHVEVMPIYERRGPEAHALVPCDPTVLAAAAPEHRATLSWMEQPVGSTTVPINTFFSLIGNDPALSLVNAAQLWYARPLLAETSDCGLPVLSAASPFKAGGAGPNSFVDIPAGPLDMKDIANLYMYANTVCVVKVNGDELREWLERSCTIFNRIDPALSTPQELSPPRAPSYLFDTIAGLTYEIDLSQPERYDGQGQVVRPDARRVTDLRHEGRPITARDSFLVVTNNYRADGGGSFPGTGDAHLVLQAPDLNRDVIVRYVMQHRQVSPVAEPIWRFRSLGRPVLLAFNGTAETAQHLAGQPGVSRLGDSAGGFTRYGLQLG